MPSERTSRNWGSFPAALWSARVFSARSNDTMGDRGRGRVYKFRARARARMQNRAARSPPRDRDDRSPREIAARCSVSHLARQQDRRNTVDIHRYIDSSDRTGGCNLFTFIPRPLRGHFRLLHVLIAVILSLRVKTRACVLFRFCPVLESVSSRREGNASDLCRSKTAPPPPTATFFFNVT